MNRKTKCFIADIATYVAFAFWIAETRYFGWYWRPSCDAERLCDSIAMGLFIFGACLGIVASLEREPKQ